MADLDIKLNCPLCGLPLVYVRTEGATLVYLCLRDGPMLLSPGDNVPRKQPQ